MLRQFGVTVVNLACREFGTFIPRAAIVVAELLLRLFSFYPTIYPFFLVAFIVFTECWWLFDELEMLSDFI